MVTVQELEAVLAELKTHDGDLWLCIEGEMHAQYAELPFWVLVRGHEDIQGAMAFLQEKLAPLQAAPEADVTVAFISHDGDHELSHGFFEGEAFFAADALARLYEQPYRRKRGISVFDTAYPHD